MNYNISFNGYKRTDVNASPNQAKKYTIQPQGILQNVMLVVIDDPGQYKILNSHSTEGLIFGPFREATGLNYYSFLRPALGSQTQIDGHPSFLFKIGMGDGTGEDFDGTMAAELRLTFLKAPQAATPTENIGTDDFPAAVFQDPVAKDWLIDTHDGELKRSADQYDYCKISLTSDPAGHINLESSVEINIFDQHGNLHHLLNTRNDKEVVINHKQNGLAMLIPIKPKTSEAGQSETITFSIGDPKVDAKVIVTEEDV